MLLTHRLLVQMYSEEKVSAAWYRGTYGALTGTRPSVPPLPVLAAAQVARRAESAAPERGQPVACAPRT